MWKWYKKQGVTIRAAVIGGGFAILAAILAGAIELFKPNPPILIQILPTEISNSEPKATEALSSTPTFTHEPTETNTPTPDPTIMALKSIASTPDTSFTPVIRRNEDGSEQVYVPSGWFIAGDMFNIGYDDETVHLVYTDESTEKTSGQK